MDGLSILEALKHVAPEKANKWQAWADKLATQDIETVADLKALKDADYEKLTQVCTPLLSSTIIILRETEVRPQEATAAPVAVADDRDRNIESLSAQLEDMKALLAVKDRDMEEMAVIFDEMNGEKERASATVAECKVELESLRAQLSVAQSEALAKGKPGEDSWMDGDIVEPLPHSTSRTEIDKGREYRAVRSRQRHTSDALREASNWFQQDLEMSKKDFQLEQMEGSLAKMEMELQATKAKCAKLQSRLNMLEETNSELVRAKAMAAKEIALLTKECANLQKQSGQATEAKTDSSSNLDALRESQVTFNLNLRQRTQLIEGLITGEDSYAAELKAFVQCVSNPALLPKSRKELTPLCNCLQSLSAIQQSLRLRLQEAKDKGGEKGFLACVETIVVQCDTYYHQYIGLLSGVKASGLYEDLTRAVQSVTRAHLEFPLGRTAYYAATMLELKEMTNPMHAAIELVSAAHTFCQQRAATLQKTQATSQQSAGLLLLQSKIHNIPDGFELVKAARVLQEETLLYLLLSSDCREVRPPPPHPATTKDIESVRVFLFNDNLLITTFNYKYRYRLELHDSQLTKQGDLTLVLKPELLASDDIKEIQEETTGVTTLQCQSTAERDLWASKIRTAIEARKKELGQKLISKSTRQSGTVGGHEEDVRVFLRVRPFVMDIEKSVGEICLSIDGHIARLDQKSLDEWREDRVGYFERIFGPESTQADVYAEVGRPVAESAINGVNCAVLCYGNTGAGKTYTMLGTATKSGLLPRTITAILAPKPNHSVAVTMGYVQVYNGRVDDLSVDGREIVKDKAGRYSGIHFGNILNSKQAMMVLLKGNELRATRSHDMNGQSSRSHAICILRVKTVSKLEGKKTSECTIQLVDLAGSENTVSTGVSGEGVKEAIEINKSLISLGRVINALNENTKRTKGKQIPVPFRESPLTVILRDVLEGEFLCHVVLNCSSSPALEQARQTAKTFAFAEGLRKLAGHKRETKDARDAKSPRAEQTPRRARSSIVLPKTFLR